MSEVPLYDPPCLRIPGRMACACVAHILSFLYFPEGTPGSSPPLQSSKGYWSHCFSSAVDYWSRCSTPHFTVRSEASAERTTSFINKILSMLTSAIIVPMKGCVKKYLAHEKTLTPLRPP